MPAELRERCEARHAQMGQVMEKMDGMMSRGMMSDMGGMGSGMMGGGMAAHHGSGGGDPMMFGWHGWWGVVAMGAFWVLVITLVVLAVWAWSRPSWEPPRAPRDILAERFARGEISEEEFETRRRVLEPHGTSGTPH